MMKLLFPIIIIVAFLFAFDRMQNESMLSGEKLAKSEKINKIDNMYIHYNNTDTYSITELKNVITETSNEIDKYLPKTKERVDIFLLEEAVFQEVFEEWFGSSGIYFSHSNEIFIRIRKPEDPLYFYKNSNEYLQNVTAHEFTHFRYDQYKEKYNIKENSIPNWVNEGFSEFIADQVSVKKPIPYDETFNEDLFIPFQLLNTVDDWNRELGDYVQVSAAVNEIIKVGGVKTFKIITSQLQEGKDFYDVLRDEFQMDVSSNGFEETIKMKMREFYTGSSG